MTQGAQYLLKRGDSSQVDTADLPAGAHYLRVISSGSTAMLALESIEPHPHGRILVWVSSLGEVIKVQEGRILSITGLRTEWTRVELPRIPDWPDIAKMQEPYRWVRVRDVRPGYRYNVRDELAIRPIPAPKNSQLRVLDPDGLSWFEERFERAPGSGDDVLPPARFAVRMNTETVVYSEVCVARDLCLIWQRWTSELQHANRQKTTQAAAR